jgi:transcriptional regulator with XRE-family HTH domain
MRAKSFGQVIRDLRTNNKEYHSLREFARKVGLSPAYLSRIENEKEPPPSEPIIERMAEALVVDKYELFSHAGKIPTEFLETFQKNPKSVASFMRRAQEYGIKTDKDWKSIEEAIPEMKRKMK